MLYVPSMTNPFVANLVPGNPAQTNLRYRASTRELLLGPRGLPLMKPPYGRITAIDLNRGEQAWMVPNGDGPRDHPAIKHLNLPPLGHASRGALARHQDAAVRARRRSGEHPDAGGRRRQEIPRARQGDRRDDLGDGAAGRRDRRADDLPASRQAVHRRGDRRTRPSGGVRRVEPAVGRTPWVRLW